MHAECQAAQLAVFVSRLGQGEVHNDDMYLDKAQFILMWFGSNRRNWCHLKDAPAIILYFSSCQQTPWKHKNQACVNMFFNTSSPSP